MPSKMIKVSQERMLAGRLSERWYSNSQGALGQLSSWSGYH